MKRKNAASDTARQFFDLLPLIIIISAVAAVVMAAVMYANIKNRARMIQSFEAKREQAYDVADMFELGSNTLTYDAKIFCETEDMEYFRDYVRELTVTRNRDVALQRLFRMGLSSREISRLQDAKIASDDLSNREMWAMELIALSKGLKETDFPKGAAIDILTEEEKNLAPQEQHRRGYQYIMSTGYFTAKSGIDTKVREFSADLMQRYGTSTVEITRLGTSNALISFLIIVALVILMTAVLVLYRHLEKENAAGLSEAMQKARAASVAKSEFLSNMSHDIRTPMNAIVGMTNMAMQSLTEDNTEQAAQDLQIVQTSSRQLLSLINDVLDLSKIESGKLVLASEAYTLPAVIRDVSAIIRPLCTAKQQQYTVELKQMKHEFVIGDQVRLRQVLLNLLNNANKYTPSGGKVRLIVSEIDNCRPDAATGSPLPDTATYRFEVCDNGIGIAREKLEEIFAPFTREVSTGVNEVEGTGLGLTIVKNIVEARGGTIHVESEKGRGSVFTCELPLKLQQEEAIASEYSLLRGKRIIVLTRGEQQGCSDACLYLQEAGASPQCVTDIRAVTGEQVQQAAAILLETDTEQQTMAAVNAIRRYSAGVPVMTLERPLLRSLLYEKLIEICSAAGTAASRSAYLEGRHIMVVDDVGVNRMIARKLLENAGATVVEAESGRAAIDLFCASEPGTYDAILMDVMMPVMGGYEATQRIRSSERADAASIPIVAMTANAFAEDARKSREAGMNDHINKPIDTEVVRKVLSGLLQ